tara:strand:- start:165 stop:287 length:123 start_codon:yes stop_codon:yes gene_type:complete
MRVRIFVDWKMSNETPKEKSKNDQAAKIKKIQKWREACKN